MLGVLLWLIAATGVSQAAPARHALPQRNVALKSPTAPQKIALAAIQRLASAGKIDPAAAARYRSAVTRAVALIPKLPDSRADPLRSQLEQAASIAPKLTAPRALAVFTQVEVNDDWFARHGPAAAQTDITDSDGVVYRYFPGGFEFHPLGNFAALNADALSKNVAATTALANALADRGVPLAGGGIAFEYYFDYSGGAAPWTSGFAQAVAAQAFERAAKVDTADAAHLTDVARGAFKSIPGRLDLSTSFGPWIKLYSFNRAVVLNAQLQTSISLASYAKGSGDTGAATLAAEMTTAAARALPDFTTGYWSYYQLPGDPSPVSYQDYVVQLLQTLSKTDSRFSSAAGEFASFGTTPPAFKLGGAGVGQVTFWVSKPSSVSISALGGVRYLSVSGGWHTVSWSLPKQAGVFPVTIHATDWVGLSSTASALPIVKVVAQPKPKKTKKPSLRKTASAASASLPPLVVGAGLDQPAQASLALSQGLGAVRMTLVWPAGATAPDPGAIAALNKLPAGTNLILELYASPLSSDSSALASYAARVASQVPALRDLVFGPAPGSASAAPAYEAALAALYDAVKAAAPSVRVAGALDGSTAPKASLAAVAAVYKKSGRPGPLMDELDYSPSPAAGKSLWTLASVPTLVSSLGSGFAATDQPGSTLPLLIDQVGFASEIPSTELSAYSSPTVGTTGIDEPTQGADYAAALKSVSCRPTVVALVLARLVDGANPGEQSGLYYADGTPKSSLSAVAAAVQTAQMPSRGCVSSTPVTQTAPTPAPAPTKTTTTSTATTTTATTTTTTKQASVADPSVVSFPDRVLASAAPSVRLGCTRACLYLVTMERAGDGRPVLATRGMLAHAGSRTVTLPKSPFPAGSYRFSVWVVGAAEPGPVTVEKSGVVSAS